jgi:hypothetical protein
MNDRKSGNRICGFCYALIAFAGLVVFAGTVRADGPFGITIGSDVASLGCEKLLSPGFYRCKSVPRPLKDFASYTVEYHKSTGICRVKGIGRDIQTNKFGDPIRDIADDFARQIEHTYGGAQKIDRLVSGSSWTGNENWIMSMLQGERLYSYTWEGSKMKNRMEHIRVTLNPRTLNIAYVVAEFQFENVKECEKRIKDESVDPF